MKTNFSIVLFYFIVIKYSTAQNIKIIEYDKIGNNLVEMVFNDNLLIKLNYLGGFDKFQYNDKRQLIKQFQFRFEEFETLGVQVDSATFSHYEDGKFVEEEYSENYVRDWNCDYEEYKKDTYNLIKDDLCLLHTLGISVPNKVTTQKIVFNKLKVELGNNRYLREITLLGLVNKIELYLTNGLLTKFIIYNQDLGPSIIEKTYDYDAKKRLISKKTVNKKTKEVLSYKSYYYEAL